MAKYISENYFLVKVLLGPLDGGSRRITFYVNRENFIGGGGGYIVRHCYEIMELCIDCANYSVSG